jgi:hypothetical protein
VSGPEVFALVCAFVTVFCSGVVIGINIGMAKP